MGDTSKTQAQHAVMVAELCARIESAETTLPLADLAASVGLSPFYVQRIFKAATGLTPHGYAAARRAMRVREALGAGASVTAAIHGAGYASGSRFYAESTALLGMTASRYRAGGAGMDIHFAIGECSLGAILVAKTALGVCAIFLGDDADTLARSLQDQFPLAYLVGGDAAFEANMAAVVGFIDAPQVQFPLPLDVRGTAFQQRVWLALRDIPMGKTVSYAELAALIGSPNAVRAVASACAANTVAVAIPCHRVVRTDGSLSGYRWGVERKRALLLREADI